VGRVVLWVLLVCFPSVGLSFQLTCSTIFLKHWTQGGKRGRDVRWRQGTHFQWLMQWGFSGSVLVFQCFADIHGSDQEWAMQPIPWLTIEKSTPIVELWGLSFANSFRFVCHGLLRTVWRTLSGHTSEIAPWQGG
jgi:hypothetical protein